MERVASFLFRSLILAIPITVVLVLVALGPDTLKETAPALVWFGRRQLAPGGPVFFLLLLTAFLGLSWAAVAAVERQRFARALASGAVPGRRVGPIGKAQLLQRTRAAVEPELRRARPRVERVVDALLGAVVDLGVAEIGLVPTASAAQLTITLGMQRLDVMQVPTSLHQAVVAQLRLIVGLDGDGRAQVELRSGEAIEVLEATLRTTQEGTALTLAMPRRTGMSRTFEELGMPPRVKSALESALVAQRGLIVLAGERASGRTQTLYALAHWLHRHHGENENAVASLEARVRVPLPFLLQMEVGEARPEAVFRGLRGGGHRVLLVRHLEHAALAAEVLAAAQEQLVVISVDAAGPIDGLARLERLCRGQRPGLADVLVLALGQRLLPALCSGCREPLAVDDPAQAPLRELVAPDVAASCQQALGCQRCGGLGFGPSPQALFWSVGPDSWLLEGLREALPGAELQQLAAQHGATPLAEAAQLAAQGLIDAREAVALAERRW